MSDLPPPNWYPDPEVAGQQRYWDGGRWTEHRAPMGTSAPTAGAPGQDTTAPQPQWDATTGAGAAPAKTNGLAIAALVIAILSFFGAFLAIGALGGILAVVLGIIGLRQVNASGGTQTGRGIAIGGIAVGGVSILVGVVVFAFFAAVTTAIQEGEFGNYMDCALQAIEDGQDPAEVC